MTVRYDDSILRLCQAIAPEFKSRKKRDLVVLRDTTGRLSTILPWKLSADDTARLELTIRESLGAYGRTDRLVAGADSLGIEPLLAEASKLDFYSVGDLDVKVIDRRMIGVDWMRYPSQSTAGIPRVVFGSLKGGVGRSTALCVAAAHLSRRGRRVLAVDLDIEAPGIGTMLLSEKELPRFGAVDYLVENNLSGIDTDFLSNVISDSFLGAEGARVSVLPAFGRSTLENPTNALGKISRAYLEDVSAEGGTISLSEQLAEMIARFEATQAYDIILIDSRAGLHEVTGATILALGAEMLMFGLDQPQTYFGYELLIAHLATFPIESRRDLRDRLNFVHAKAEDSSEALLRAKQRFSALYEPLEPESVDGELEVDDDLGENDVNFVWSADLMELDALLPPETPPVLHFLDDARYRSFDPISNGGLLSSLTYEVTFKELLRYFDSLIEHRGSDNS